MQGQKGSPRGSCAGEGKASGCASRLCSGSDSPAEAEGLEGMREEREGQVRRPSGQLRACVQLHGGHLHWWAGLDGMEPGVEASGGSVLGTGG